MPPSIRIWTALVALNLVAAGVLLGLPGVAVGHGGPFDGPSDDAPPFNVPPEDRPPFNVPPADAPPFNVPPEDRPPIDDGHGPDTVDDEAGAEGEDDRNVGEDG